MKNYKLADSDFYGGFDISVVTWLQVLDVWALFIGHINFNVCIIHKSTSTLKISQKEDVAALRGVPSFWREKGEIGGRAALTQGDGDTHHYLHIFPQHRQRWAPQLCTIKSVTFTATLASCSWERHWQATCRLCYQFSVWHAMLKNNIGSARSFSKKTWQFCFFFFLFSLFKNASLILNLRGASLGEF